MVEVSFVIPILAVWYLVQNNVYLLSWLMAAMKVH